MNVLIKLYDFVEGEKTKNALLHATWLTAVLAYFQKYIFDDWQILATILVLISLDTILGVWKHIKYDTVSSKGWGSVLEKLVLYFLLLAAGWASSHTADAELNVVTLWFYLAIKSFISVRELISITENAAAIRPGIVPKWITKRLKQFDKDGKFIVEENSVSGGMPPYEDPPPPPPQNKNNYESKG